jgi:membrane-associated phospholipid phosphatase
VPPLLADIWMRRGLSLLWGASALAKVMPQEVLSLRTLFRLAAEGFPAALPSNGGKLLIATGLEGALDALSPDQAETWAVERVRPLLERFQEAWDGEGALGFWLPSGHARIVSRPAGAAYDWRLATGHGGKTLPLSGLIFAGAEDDLKRIVDDNADRAAAWIGLYHPRVS